MNFEFLSDAVREIEKMSFCADEGKALRDGLHIAYGIDDGFVRPMGVAMTSLLVNHPHEDLVFHVLTEEISKQGKAMLTDLARQYHTTIYLYYIDGAVFERLPATAHFTKATYNRFLLPKALPAEVKRVVYLDADILCLSSAAGLKAVDFQGAPACVVDDIEAVVKRQVRSLGLSHKRYFNAGFLYIDVAAWNQARISEKALQVSFERLGKLDWLDQDALNIVMGDLVQYLEQKYDYIFDLGANSNVKSLPEDTVFVHYAGRFKPWHSWCIHPLKKDFLHFASLSPWKDVPDVPPQTYKDMKKMAKSYQTFGHYAKAFLWYGKYSYHKIRQKFHL